MTTQQKPTKKQYSSLGAMIAKKDFEALFEKLKQYENDEDDRKTLLTFAKDSNFSIADELLYSIPRFAVKDKEVVEEEEDLMFGMMAGNSIEKPVIEDAELCPYVLESVDLLLKLGANPNATLINGITATILSATINTPDLLKVLINNPHEIQDPYTAKFSNLKGDVTAKDNKGHDLLYYAAISNSLNTLQYLVEEQGLDMNRQMFFYENKTLLHLLCEGLNQCATLSISGFDFERDINPHTQPAIEKLIELGVDARISDNHGNVPEMNVPFEDDEIYEDEEIPEETKKNWEEVYELVGNHRKYQEMNKKQLHKISF